MSRRSVPYGVGDRPLEARRPRGLLDALAALEYETRCLGERDVLWGEIGPDDSPLADPERAAAICAPPPAQRDQHLGR